MTIKEKIQELNIIFKKRGWELLSENNEFNEISDRNWEIYHMNMYLFINRSNIPYELHKNKFTTVELDKFVFEFIEEFCKKHEILGVYFFNSDYTQRNSIKVNE